MAEEEEDEDRDEDNSCQENHAHNEERPTRHFLGPPLGLKGGCPEDGCKPGFCDPLVWWFLVVVILDLVEANMSRYDSRYICVAGSEGREGLHRGTCVLAARLAGGIVLANWVFWQELLTFQTFQRGPL